LDTDGTTIPVEVETVTITLEQYTDLIEGETFLMALEYCGLDNWSGYEDAREQVAEWEAQWGRVTSC